MKKLIIFNPSIDGGGVERNIKLIFGSLNKKLHNKVYFVSCDKLKGLDKSIINVRPIINIKTRNRIIKYLICIFSVLKIYLNDKNLVIFAFQANVYAIILSKLLRIKIIIRANSAPSVWTNRIKIFIIKKFYHLADKIIVNSYEFQKEVKKIFNTKSTVIYNPINKKELIYLSRIKKKFPFFDDDKKSLKIINVGRLTYQKNQIELLKIINSLKDKIPVKLLIIGNGPEKFKLNEYINKHKLKNHVQILPYTKNPYVYFKKSQIFILSSLYEGLPNVLLEATFLKLLCISYKCKTGPNEILSNGKGGFLVAKHDIKKISYILNKYYYSKNRLVFKKMINFSFKGTNRYDLDNQKNEYHALIMKFLK